MFHFKLIYLKILFFAFLSFLFIFLALHIFLSFDLKYQTEVAYCSTISKKINTCGVIFKNEKILNYCKNNEILKNIYRDGSHVAANSKISKKYYKESDIENLEKIKKLDDKINSLEKIQKSAKTSEQNLNDLNNQVYSTYFDLNEALKQNNYQSYFKLKNKIIDCFNKKQLLIGKVKDFNDSIKNLKKQRASISNLISSYEPKTIKTPIAGYICSKIDGFEEECSLEKVKNLNSNQLEELYNCCCKNKNNFSLGNKIIYDPQVFLKVLLPSESSFDGNVGSMFVLNLQQINEEFDAELIDFNLGKNGQKGLATFEINSMTEKLASLRKSKVEINFKNYYGLKINKSAVRKNEQNETGVYVKIGSFLKFKLVDILTENDDFIISKIHDENENYVRELDEVVIKGKDLYNRKKIK